MAEGEGGYYSCYFKNEYGEAVSSGWVEVMETPPVHQKMHDKHHHDEEQMDFNANNPSHSVLLLSTVIGAVVGLLLAALALLYCTKYQVACSKLHMPCHSISLNADAINVMFDIWMNNGQLDIYTFYIRENAETSFWPLKRLKLFCVGLGRWDTACAARVFFIWRDRKSLTFN